MSADKPLIPLQKKRRYTKYAMAGTLAVLVVTGLKKGKKSKDLHAAAGYALIGLSLYHTSLYKNRS